MTKELRRTLAQTVESANSTHKPLLPPPQSDRLYMMAAARRRGWTLEEIAQVCGISHQGVQQNIARYEKYHGAITPRAKTGSIRSSTTKKFFRCKTCGSAEWKLKGFKNEDYCSRKCSGVAKRCMSKEEILWAIDRRVTTGDTWLGLSKILNQYVQTIQSNIWVYLAQENLLTVSVIKRIWEPSPSLFRKQGRWNWLVERTGLAPTRRRDHPSEQESAA